MDNINIHRVLIAPLDWGLGHATRCIPIIKAFQSLGCEVLIAADGAVAKLIEHEFPTINIIHLEGYQIQYAKTANALAWKLLFQIPKILSRIKNENDWLDAIIDSEKIDLVISDNRYGLYSKKIPTVFITHQLCIKTPFPFLEEILRKINYRFINRFSACWVPDVVGDNNVAGLLSHPKTLPKIPVHYIGILSRMVKLGQEKMQFDYCFLLSGPEPQRTILENSILKSLPKIPGKIVIVRGLPATASSLNVSEHIKVFNHLPTKELASILSLSNLIICRSGYTSIMELIGLEKDAILIPTPGQTEQEYLAEKLHAAKRFLYVKKDQLNILEAINCAKDFSFIKTDFPIFTTNELEALLHAL